LKPATAKAQEKMRLVLAVVLFLIFAVAAKAQSEKAAPAAAAPAAGLAVGEKTPEFEGTDQFGHAVTNETLRGSRGTIVLFFRSADW
jgi:cytochrome oxidase Cu insertion factor (SCO1/SenC/PrrC family)